MNVLKTGCKGANVAALKLGLIRAGLYNEPADGVFDAETKAAVIDFQKRNGLCPNGEAGAVTFELLKPYIMGCRQDAGKNIVPTDMDYSYCLLKMILAGLKKRYPFLEVSSIGKSVMGRNIYCVGIGGGNNEVFYNAAHHANEWITAPLLLKFIEDYANAYAAGESISDIPAKTLFEKTGLFVAPLVNPDGVDLVTGAVDNGVFFARAKGFAANYPLIPFPGGWKANIDGVDLNLAYPAGWEEAKKLKYEQGFISPGPRDFVGCRPLSAPESKAVYDFTLKHDFKLVLAYHTQGREIYWKYKDCEPAHSRDIAGKMSAASGYTLEIAPEYSANAGYRDWFIKKYGRPGFTVEAGYGVSPLPVRMFDEIYEENIGILVEGLLFSMHNS
ncbi:MAG: peptidoglycan-binding protein [Oscillospiraceae bacterium]|nr:peptidoglycan-binding protein [Oscillospiraceae bacterium]